MKRIFMAMIRFYRKRISPLKPPCCRFTPTCSAYALEAFEKRGCIAGFVLMVWRILRCSPLSPAGYDPVPEEGFRTLPMRWSTFRRMQDELPKIPLGDVPCDTAETSCEHLNANGEAESTTKTESEGPRA